jgi:hypothetical protein
VAEERRIVLVAGGDPGEDREDQFVEEPVSEEEPVSDEVTRDDGKDLDDDVASATPSPGKMNKEQVS